jgi:virginiamycin A acetyltransferase
VTEERHLPTSNSGYHPQSQAPLAVEDLLFALYRLRPLRASIIRWAQALDSGSLELRLLRRIFASYHDIVVGEYSYGGCFNAQRVAADTRIGKFCSFAQRIHIFAANHKLNAVTTHPFIYNPSLGIVHQDLREYNPVQIGNDVWMGQDAMIMPSVSQIQDGVVIAAGAIVTKDVPAYAVVAGVPARIIKYRFSEDIIEALLEIQWWNWSPSKIFSLAHEFNDVRIFLRIAQKMRYRESAEVVE